VVDKYVEMAPKVGMNFDCEEKAYEMYNTYAGLVGFSVRKSKTKRHKSDNSLSQKYFVCSGEGYRKNEASQWISQGPVVMLVSKQGECMDCAKDRSRAQPLSCQSK
jgi:hypothetical protein